jgi:hypothetical protein
LVNSRSGYDGVKMPRLVFTIESCDALRDMAASGLGSAEIAAAIGSTPASVRVKASQLKVSLGGHGRRRRSLVVPLALADFRRLEAIARARDCPPEALVGQIINYVLRDDLVAAVLDVEGSGGML